MQAVSRNGDSAAAVANAPVVNWASTLRYGSSPQPGASPLIISLSTGMASIEP